MTLVHYRRLAGSVNPHRIVVAVTGVVTATGVIRGRSRQVLDSTVSMVSLHPISTILLTVPRSYPVKSDVGITRFGSKFS